MIRQARVIDPGSGYDQVADLLINDGRIQDIGEIETVPDAEVVVAKGLLAIPGIVDLAVHSRDLGHAFKATIASETYAALASGVTTFCCTPDTEPATDSPATVRLIQERARLAGNCHVKVIGALSKGLGGEKLSNMAALAENGCVGVSNMMIPPGSTAFLKRALEYAAGLKLTVFFYPFDQSLANGACAHDGVFAARCGLDGMPYSAETAALAQCIELVRETGVRIHFCRLSSARSMTLLNQAHELGLNVSADVAAYQLTWNEEKVEHFDPNFHLLPPLREESDQKALQQAVTNNKTLAICSDHQPHELGAKLSPYPTSATGISALETLLPMCLKLAEEQGLTLHSLLSALTYRPARILNLECGRLCVGAPADLSLFDPNHVWTVDKRNWFSRGENTPFWGETLKGKVAATFVAGRLAYKAGFFKNGNLERV